MLGNALIFIAQVVFSLLTLTLLLRFYLQWVRAPYRNPLADFVNALTDFMVRPARRVLPGLWGIDLPTLLLAWLMQLLEWLIVLQVRGFRFGAEVGMALVGIAAVAAVAVAQMFAVVQASIRPPLAGVLMTTVGGCAWRIPSARSASGR